MIDPNTQRPVDEQRATPPRDPSDIPQSDNTALFAGLGVAALVVMGILFFASGDPGPTNTDTAANQPQTEKVEPNTPPGVRTE